MRNKVIQAAEAAALIHSGDTLATSGFVGIGTPDCLLHALEQRFLQSGEPRDLTLLFAAGQGDGKDQGLNRLGHDGLLKRVIGAHFGLIPRIAQLALQDRIEAWCLPQGVISQMYRDTAAGKPGTLSRVGLETFIDPLLGGGRINQVSHDNLVERVELAGETLLFYKAHPVQVAFIRATTADGHGNLTMEREALTLDALAMAMAARNSGGVVIAQVERIARTGSLASRQVKIPGTLVDAVVVAPPELHRQTYATPYSPAFAGEIQVPLDHIPTLPLDERKIIARRCAMELPVEGVVNLGIGMPEGVSAVANEEGILDLITLTAEPGIVGGMPASGLDFGAGLNIEALVDQNQQFDFYDGGGLDMACLGMAECDALGQVNVSRFGPRLAGPGGFINISQNARRLVFAGTFTAGGLQVTVESGSLSIVHEGRSPKFCQEVQQVTFSGPRAARLGQPVLYVTERCVFELTAAGLRLAEIAPGIDLERDILRHMAFTPLMDPPPKLMDARIFAPGPMGLRDDLLQFDLSSRIVLDHQRQLLFLDFQHLRVRREVDVREIERHVEAICQPLNHPVIAVVNYDGFSLDEAVAESYAQMAARVESKYYSRVARYATGAFTRLRMGQVFASADRARSRLFQSQREALHAAGLAGTGGSR